MLLPIPFQNLHKILLHVDVDCAVTCERAAAFDVAGEGGDKVRILNQLVNVADEGYGGPCGCWRSH